MNREVPPPPLVAAPTRVRYGVLLFACSLAMITYLDRVCFGTVAPFITDEFWLGPKQVGLLFTAFAFAYAVFEVPSGWLGDVFGPRKTLIRIVLWWSLFTALTGAIYGSFFGPTAAFYIMLAIRFCFGMGEAGAFPNIARAFHNWFPATERGSAQGAVWMAGRFAGGVSPLIVTALIWQATVPDGATREPSRNNVTASATIALQNEPLAAATYSTAFLTNPQHFWRHVFWVFGLLGVAWVVLFWLWFKDRPEQHAGVNAAEIALIRGKLPTGFSPPDEPITAPPEILAGSAPRLAVTEDVGGSEPPGEESSEGGHVGVPWGRLLSSTNLWALCLLYFFTSYGWYFSSSR
jgi:MFS family permease